MYVAIDKANSVWSLVTSDTGVFYGPSKRGMQLPHYVFLQRVYSFQSSVLFSKGYHYTFFPWVKMYIELWNWLETLLFNKYIFVWTLNFTEQRRFLFYIIIIIININNM